MDLKRFYDVIRPSFKLTPENIKGFDYLISEGMEHNIIRDELAYILATTWHETAHTMQPVREYGGETYLKSKKYYPYVGMGYVQLTWKVNYQKATDYFQKVLGIKVDFVKNPKLLLKKEYASIILIVGMQQGWFTGKKLDDYIDGIKESEQEDLREFSNARRIVNGVDKQVLIGQYALTLQKALLAAGYEHSSKVDKSVSQPVVVNPSVPMPDTSPKASTSLLEAILRVLKSIFKVK